MAEIIKTACIQLNSGPDIAESLTAAEGFIREAASQGAQLIATPENTCHIRGSNDDLIASALYDGVHPGPALFSDLAKELSVHLLIGSMAIKVSDKKVANRSFLFGPDGALITTYDKIHMFDVSLKEDREYFESNKCEPGTQAVVADIGKAKLGLSICYDVRFAYLYRDLAKAGANILACPAAFTVPTGRAHWEVLLRARAIETGSYMIAPGQVGEHESVRRTWGHSLIINPWGEIMAEKDDGVGIITADLNMSTVKKARGAIPALQHDREYTVKA